MGGDNAPVEIVKGALDAAREDGIPVILVGDEKRLAAELGKHRFPESLVSIRHASEVVEMAESPSTVLRRKPDSSLVVSACLVKNREAQAMVSAGNTGAAMAVATLKFGRIKGIVRPAIASMMPTIHGKAVLLDAGANVDCSVENLLQFAMMGDQYAEHVLGVPNPRVGLLSIGEEPTKGDELTKATNAALQQVTDINFIGNVEGKELFRGEVDVVVCDGFAGNLVLKISEGVAELMVSMLKSGIKKNPATMLGGLLVKPAFQALKNKLDYAEYGGAPLLGLDGVCIISHGRSNARAIQNAIRAAAKAVEGDVVGCITKAAESVKLPVGETASSTRP
jgi:glycerol-3-phosphate acyltransferase PlsX